MPRGFRRTPPAFLHYPTGVMGVGDDAGFWSRSYHDYESGRGLGFRHSFGWSMQALGAKAADRSTTGFDNPLRRKVVSGALQKIVRIHWQEFYLCHAPNRRRTSTNWATWYAL
jgi:hypothetical protein